MRVLKIKAGLDKCNLRKTCLSWRYEKLTLGYGYCGATSEDFDPLPLNRVSSL